MLRFPHTAVTTRRKYPANASSSDMIGHYSIVYSYWVVRLDYRQSLCIKKLRKRGDKNNYPEPKSSVKQPHIEKNRTGPPNASEALIVQPY